MSKIKIIVCSCFLLVAVLQAWSQGAEKLLPYPQRVEWKEQKPFRLHQGGLQADQRIRVCWVDSLSEVPLHQEEAYCLKINARSVCIEATTSTGVYRGFQTLEQLIYEKKGHLFLPACQITDWPAFRVRGFMQDVGRTYISMEELKREIDLLSRFKINVFHWHLTENQAWRLESKVYPELNSPENMTRMKGKFYTHQEARELVEYCKQRHVLLIPEIDMPGHSAAFVKTFGTDMQSEKGMEILKALLEEACAVFEVPYMHIGTDEVKFTNPRFVPEMVAYVRSKGKKVISWNPGWKYKKGEIDMTQLWSYRGKAQPGIPAIDCRLHYINHYDTYADLVTLYNSRIYNQPSGSEEIAGSIIALWNDRFIEDEKQIVRDNNLYAYMLAFAERSWRGGGYGYFDGKENLLWPDQPEVLARFADFENRLLWHKQHTFHGEPFPYVRQANVQWRITDAFPNEGDLQRSFPPEQEEGVTYTYEGQTYGSRRVNGAGVYLRHVWGTTVPGFYARPQENHTAYAFTWIYSPKDQAAGLFLDFQNYSRSESDLPPLSGTWDYKGSRAWLNGQELLPPTWKSTHRVRSNEVPMTNENATSRLPLPIRLHKGWNKLLLKLPVGKFRTPEVRLVKWMFNAVVVTPDGKNALEGIVYSPDRKIPLPDSE